MTEDLLCGILLKAGRFDISFEERVCTKCSTCSPSNCSLSKPQSGSGCCSIMRLHKASQQIAIDCSREQPLFSADNTDEI